MRRFFNILAVIALVMGCSTGACAQDIEANGIFYNIISDTQVAVAPALFDGVNHYAGCIILPERVYCDGVNYEVAAIAPRAFWQSSVTQVQIPNSVTMIGEAAFADAEDLTDITLPLGLTAVSRYMLAGTAVANVVLPEGVTDIEKGAFEDCSQLHTIYLPMTLRTIDEHAFGYCVSLKEVYCDASVPPLMLGDDTFEGVSGVQVMLPDAATTRRYQNDDLWGDEDLFSLWVDEGLAVLPTMEQETVGGNWVALNLGRSLAYKIYGPDGYLTAITAADRYYLPIGASSEEYLVVPTTLMYDEEDLQLVAQNAPAAIEELEGESAPDFTIIGFDGMIYVDGDTHGLKMYVYDMFGREWYCRTAVNNWISLPGQRVYIVRVGDTVRKVLL